MTGKGLIGEAELAPLANERGNAHSKLCAETEANGRQNRTLNDDVSNAYRSALANPPAPRRASENVERCR